MVDVETFGAIHAALKERKRHSGMSDSNDDFGNIHVILFGDFKQLPPATSKARVFLACRLYVRACMKKTCASPLSPPPRHPLHLQAPFIVLPLVHDTFDFRVLRQNRRVVTDEGRRTEIERFHEVLDDVSFCRVTDAVKAFLVAAYVRGARVDSAERAPLEGLTAVFTKRRYRDAWNRAVMRKIAQAHNHSLKIKARLRARGARGQTWYGEKLAKLIRSKTRAQNSWLLQLAGDHHSSFETKPVMHTPHLMRVMLNSNLAVDQRFANGCPFARI